MKQCVSFALLVGGLVLALKVAGWLPLALETGTVRTYKTVEAARTAVKPKRFFMPSYFPQYLSWPASEVLAGKKPGQVFITHFSRRDTGEIVLAVSQSMGQPPTVRSRIEPVRVVKEELAEVKGRELALLSAVCGDGLPCNKVLWREDGYEVSVIVRDSMDEALKIAKSMLLE